VVGRELRHGIGTVFQGWSSDAEHGIGNRNWMGDDDYIMG